MYRNIQSVPVLVYSRKINALVVVTSRGYVPGIAWTGDHVRQLWQGRRVVAIHGILQVRHD